MAVRWTEDQLAAIEDASPSLLVSAAAGSGKTAVLVARVLRALRGGGDVTRLLIVTFTRAAAAEMRERIAQALDRESADPHLYRQQQRLSRAQISTLHTFCQTVIRRHFELLVLDPQAHIGDDATLARLLNSARDEAMEAAYEHPTDDQAYLFDCAAPEDIAAMAENTRRFLLAMPDPWDWADRVTAPYEGTLSEMPVFQALMRLTAERLREAGETLDECEALLRDPLTPARYENILVKDRNLWHDYLRAAEQGTLRGGTVKFDVMPRGKKDDVDDEDAKQRYADARNRWKEQMKDAVDPLPRDDGQAVADERLAAGMARGLCRLVRDIQDRYQALKLERSVLDYNDLEHGCLALLRQEAVARELAGQYDMLLVDEYQDISPIQEEIIQALHRGNQLFMVGDVKQSIYRFRQAEPALFMDKYERFPVEPGGAERKVLLKQNFRSARNVLDSVNEVFSAVMHRQTLEIEYDDSAALRPGPEAAAGPETELRLLISADEDTGEEQRVTASAQWESRFIAERIRALVQERDPAQPTRPRYRYRDIVILLRNAASYAAVYADALRQAGIPFYADADAQYYNLREIQDVMNLLRVIDNPYQDLPLMAVCRIPCFGFSAEELATVRIRDTSPATPYHQVFMAAAAAADTPVGVKAADLLARFDRWRFLCGRMPLDVFIRLLLDESGIYYAAGAAEDGASRQANLRLLSEKAAESGTLCDFLQRTDLRTSTDDSRTAKALSDQEDVVRIMTMHKSKGLEFPVVILAGLARKFHSVKTDAPLLDPQLGIALSMIDPEERILRHTMTERVMQERLDRKAKAEEARILYVAMTRAKERLILYGSPALFSTSLDHWRQMRTRQAALRAGCMLDWIVPALQIDAPEADLALTTANGSRWRVVLEPVARLEDAPPTAFTPPEPETGDVSPALLRMLTAQETEGRPLKVAVSALNKHPLTENDLEETPQKKRDVSRETLETHPRFMQEHALTAAERGSAVHKALGLLPYDRLRGPEQLSLPAMTALLDELRERRQLTEQERQAVRPAALIRFFESPTGQRALRSPLARREWSFNLRLDASACLQGVIDLCFLEDGGWVLVDYKTDAVDQAETLIERYENQLLWYSRALTKLTDYPVREAILYSVPLADAVRVPLGES